MVKKIKGIVKSIAKKVKKLVVKVLDICQTLIDSFIDLAKENPGEAIAAVIAAVYLGTRGFEQVSRNARAHREYKAEKEQRQWRLTHVYDPHTRLTIPIKRPMTNSEILEFESRTSGGESYIEALNRMRLAY